MTKIDAVQVNLIYLIFNSSNFLVDTNEPFYFILNKSLNIIQKLLYHCLNNLGD